VVLQEDDCCWNAAVAECQQQLPGQSSPTVQWGAALQTSVNYHWQLAQRPIGDVTPVKLIVQYPTQTAVKRPSAGDDARSRVQHTL